MTHSLFSPDLRLRRRGVSVSGVSWQDIPVVTETTGRVVVSRTTVVTTSTHDRLCRYDDGTWGLPRETGGTMVSPKPR